MTRCCLCDGQLILLGQLGHAKQFRCRQCGMIFSSVHRARSNQPKNRMKKLRGKQTPEENQEDAP